MWTHPRPLILPYGNARENNASGCLVSGVCVLQAALQHTSQAVAGAGSAAELAESRRLVESHQHSLAAWEAGVAEQMQIVSELQVGGEGEVGTCHLLQP